MNKKTNKSFIKGIIAGISLTAIFDLLIVHWIFGLHRIYNHQSVNIVEPLLFVLGIIIVAFIFYYEYKKH